jgi:hypothetical protein
MRVPQSELLWWRGCPSTERAVADLRAALRDVGAAGAEIRLREIVTGDDARSAGFVGSPTVLIDGADLVPMPDEPTGLNCRVYRRRDGSVAPTPDPDDLRDAIRRATEEAEAR